MAIWKNIRHQKRWKGNRINKKARCRREKTAAKKKKGMYSLDKSERGCVCGSVNTERGCELARSDNTAIPSLSVRWIIIAMYGPLRFVSSVDGQGMED